MLTNAPAEVVGPEAVLPGDVPAALVGVEVTVPVVDAAELQAASRPARTVSAAARIARFTRVPRRDLSALPGPSGSAFPANDAVRSDRSGDQRRLATGSRRCQ